MKIGMAAIRGANQLVGSAILLVAAAIAVMPLLIDGPSCGHDYGFHLASWFDALESWRHGIVYPHWATDPNYGAGEPRFVFYPPLSWMLGAALGAVLPWHIVPAAMSFLMLAACGLGTRALARSLLSEAQATLAGCLAIFSGYAPYCVYARTAYGELLGGFWIAAILLLALRSRKQEGNAWQRALDGSTALLSLAIAGAWLSNGPVGVIACYLLVSVATLAAILERSWAKVIRATVATALGMALAGFYLVPVAQERSWVDMRKATDEPWTQIENNFIFAENSSFYNPDPAVKEHDRVNHQISQIGVIMLSLAAGALVIAWSRDRLPNRQQWMPLAAIPLGVLFLLLPISQPVWELLPLMRMLQFPWRLLLILEAPTAIFVTLAIWPNITVRKSRRRKPAAKTWLDSWQLTAAVILCGTLLVAETVIEFDSFPTCTAENSFATLLSSFTSGSGMSGQLEYAPDGADNSLVPWRLPGACVTSQPLTALGVAAHPVGSNAIVYVWDAQQSTCETIYEIEKGTTRRGMEHYGVKAVLWHPGYLILRLRRYPAWQVSVNGRRVETMPERVDGLMAVPVPTGMVNVDVDWTATPDVIAGRWISVMGALALTGLWLLERKGAPRKLYESRASGFESPARLGREANRPRAG